MNSPRLNWQLLLITLLMLLGFGLILASSILKTDTMIAIFTAFSALGTLAAAIAAAISARSSSQIANRWQEEERYKLLLENWKVSERLTKELMRISRKLHRSWAHDSLEYFVHELEQEPEEFCNEFKRIEAEEYLERIREHLPQLIDLCDELNISLCAWQEWETRPETHALLIQSENATNKLLYSALRLADIVAFLNPSIISTVKAPKVKRYTPEYCEMDDWNKIISLFPAISNDFGYSEFEQIWGRLTGHYRPI